MRMRPVHVRALLGLVCLAVALSATAAPIVEYKSGIVWPRPATVDPGPAGGPPSDAVVLFDGKSLARWNGGEKWIIRDGYAVADKGPITSKDSFGDCQVHLEWASPDKVSGTGQGRGNSGIFLMGKYEVQILDSFNNETYFDGQAAAIYKQQPPMVNATRGPGQWQTYDILFTAPRFDAAGQLVKPGYVTVLHNGVAVQNHFELQGDTSYVRPPRWEAHPSRLPITLQYHNNPVRFRNIWVRELKPMVPLSVPAPKVPAPASAAPAAAACQAELPPCPPPTVPGCVPVAPAPRPAARR